MGEKRNAGARAEKAAIDMKLATRVALLENGIHVYKPDLVTRSGRTVIQVGWVKVYEAGPEMKAGHAACRSNAFNRSGLRKARMD